MTSTAQGYSIIITRKDGTKDFALGVVGIYFTTKWGEANQFRRELLEHGMKGKVVKATCTITTP